MAFVLVDSQPITDRKCVCVICIFAYLHNIIEINIRATSLFTLNSNNGNKTHKFA